MASSAWAIRVGVDLDTSDIQSQLDKAAQGTKINLDTDLFITPEEKLSMETKYKLCN